MKKHIKTGPIQSMTGFGNATGKAEKFDVRAEVRSVNQRFLKISLRIPDQLRRFEDKIHTLIKKHVTRGAVTVYLSSVYSINRN